MKVIWIEFMVQTLKIIIENSCIINCLSYTLNYLILTWKLLKLESKYVTLGKGMSTSFIFIINMLVKISALNSNEPKSQMYYKICALQLL